MNKEKKESTCAHCGQPVYVDEYSSMWIHDRKLGKGDNGYWCHGPGSTSADGRSKEEYGFRQTHYFLERRDGIWMVQDKNTGEWAVDPYYNTP